jgi:hypothetical protein
MLAADPAPIRRPPHRPPPAAGQLSEPSLPRATAMRRVLAQAPPAEVALWLTDGQRRAVDARLPERVRAAAREQVAVCQALLVRRATASERATGTADAGVAPGASAAECVHASG